MANAIDDALNRASQEQREQQVINEARRNIQLVSVRQMGDVSSTDAASIAKNAQVIEEAKRTIPFETMQDVKEVSPPLNTPATKSNYNSTVIELHPNAQNTVENIDRGEGNNYLRENAVDRAMNRPAQEIDRTEQQHAMGR